MTDFLWKPTESYERRAGNGPRKMWSNFIILHVKKLKLMRSEGASPSSKTLLVNSEAESGI